jgi:hypothetical protein
VTAVTWESYGQAKLVDTGNGTVRTANPNGNIGAHPVYARFASKERFEPPFTWSGQIRVRDRLDKAYIKSEERWAPWDWGIVFHPMHDSNNENHAVVLSDKRQTTVRVSAECTVNGIHDYQYRTGLESRYKAPQVNLIDNRWHGFRCEVISYGEYKVFIDNLLMAHVVEQSPTTIQTPTQVALRLDFFDVELGSVTVTQPTPTPTKGSTVNFTLLDPNPANRILDTRGLPRPKERTTHTWEVQHPLIPDNAVALEVNLHAVVPTKPGYLTAWAKGDWPEMTSILYNADAVSNQVTVQIDRGRFRTLASSHVHYIMDVVGYYTPA